VIYVHFFDRLVKRLLSKGFLDMPKNLGYKRKVFNTDLSDIKMAIFSDPNGLEVRIMELIRQHLGEEDNSKKTVIFDHLFLVVCKIRILHSPDN
jgi:hypothetical protein